MDQGGIKYSTSWEPGFQIRDFLQNSVKLSNAKLTESRYSPKTHPPQTQTARKSKNIEMRIKQVLHQPKISK